MSYSHCSLTISPKKVKFSLVAISVSFCSMFLIHMFIPGNLLEAQARNTVILVKEIAPVVAHSDDFRNLET